MAVEARSPLVNIALRVPVTASDIDVSGMVVEYESLVAARFDMVVSNAIYS